MVEIIDSGLSDHLIAPGFAALTLPAIRSMPEWFRWIVNTVSSIYSCRVYGAPTNGNVIPGG